MEYGPTFCGLLIISELYRNGRQYNNDKSENNHQSYKYKKSFGPNFASAYDKVLSREKRYSPPSSSLETPSISFSSSNVSVSILKITSLNRNFLPKNQHSQGKLLNFENSCCGELQNRASV